MIQAIISGIVFGAMAGVSPGPLLTFVIASTLKTNFKRGVIISFAPLFSDLPIVGVILLLINKLSNIYDYSGFLSIISFSGACMLTYLGWQMFKVNSVNFNNKSGEENITLKKAIFVNILNPHPYLFWLTIGGPMAIKTSQSGILSAIAFIFCFYLLLVGSKIVIVFITDKSKSIIKDSYYSVINKLLSISLIIFALLFFYDGLKQLGII